MRRLGAIAFTGVLAVLLAVPAAAQIHGTPASVTSAGGQRTMAAPPGVPASVTSLGPQGWHAPRFPTTAQPFPTHFEPFPTHIRTRPPFGQGRHGRFDGRFHRRGAVAFPVFVPYATPVVYVESPPQVIVVERAGPTIFERGYVPAEPDRYGHRYFDERDRRPAPPAEAEPEPRPEYAEPPEQIATVLIFRDGAELEVFNYAIVGDLLYNLNGPGPRRIKLTDLDVEATVEANDQRGVLFRLPRSRG
jgi:hypothetical protein